MTTQVSVPAKYNDKLDLIQKSLEIYRIVRGIHFTQRDMDMIALCFLFDINDPTFNDKLLGANIDINSVEHIQLLKSRLKKKGFLVQDSRSSKKKYLEPGLAYLKKAVMENEVLEFNIKFLKA